MQVVCLNNANLADGNVQALKEALRGSLAKDLTLELRENAALAAAYVTLDVAFTFTLQKPAQGGYGLSLLNNGHGNFIVSTREGSIGQQALAEGGHAVEAGLRITMVNGTDVTRSPKPVCVALMKEADSIEIAVALDPANHRIMMAIKEGVLPLPQVATGEDLPTVLAERAKPFANMTQLFMRPTTMFAVPPELEDSKNGAFDWGADTAFSPVELEAPVFTDPVSLYEARALWGTSACVRETGPTGGRTMVCNLHRRAQP